LGRLPMRTGMTLKIPIMSGEKRYKIWQHNCQKQDQYYEIQVQLYTPYRWVVQPAIVALKSTLYNTPCFLTNCAPDLSIQWHPSPEHLSKAW
jgi:hypothetical protein